MSILNKYRNKANRLLAEYNSIKNQIRDEKEELKKAKQHQKDVAKAHSIIQSVAQEIQQIAHKRVSDIVSECLRSIFREAYKFRIRFDRKRGRTEARLCFIRNGHEIDPTMAAGGGPRAVASFALRLASLLLARPSPRRLLVLDEPFAAVDAENSERIRELLLRLSKEFDIQIMMVTHNASLECGKVVQIS